MNSQRSRRHASLLAASLGLLALMPGAPAAAQRTVERLGTNRPEVLVRWRQTLEESDRLLQAGEWKRVRKTTNRLLTEMCDRIESGAAAARYLGVAAVQRGIAEAGLGNERDALWDWEMAVALHQELAELDLGAYGEGGARLGHYRDMRPTPETTFASFLVAPPKRLRTKMPKYPRAKKIACLEESIVVRAIIDGQGVTQRPELPSPKYPILGFAAMDVLRHWRFEPARLAGEPVAVVYNLEANFNIRLCQNPVAIRERARQRRDVTDKPPDDPH